MKPSSSCRLVMQTWVVSPTDSVIPAIEPCDVVARRVDRDNAGDPLKAESVIGLESSKIIGDGYVAQEVAA
jgi:hypothetical protein